MAGGGYVRLLRDNPDFRHLWYGQIVSQMGDWFNLITLQALLLRVTGSSAALAWLAVCQMLPLLLLGPLAGVTVDRLPRKAVMIAADLVRAVVALGFLLVRDQQTVWLVYPLVALLASFAAFFEPARTATIPNVTRPADLLPANALSAVTWSVILTSGALAGGAVSALFGQDVAFLVNSASFLLSAWCILRVRVPARAAGAHSPARGGASDLCHGLAYMRSDRGVATLLTVKAASGLAGGVTLLVVIFGKDLLPLPGKEKLGIGLLWAARGFGTALGPVVARRTTGSDPHRMRWAIALAFLQSGFFYLAFSQAGSLGMAALALILAHLGGSILWVFSTTLLQTTVPDAFRGRVFATDMALLTLSTVLSNLVVGQGMDRFGIGPRPMGILLGTVLFVPGIAWVIGMLRVKREE